MEKAKKGTKTLADLPAWYRRIRSSEWDDEDGYPYLPETIFDEDISELGEEEDEQELCLKRHWSDEWEGGHKVGIQFIGENYFRMLVSRDVITISEPEPLPASAPEILEFVGIDEERIKGKAEMKKY
ncbi:hypothetical protein F4813DRAFT_389418 [Daldinia decipiens]|uniref:uncharacterized protein n=1 Tax=Daldinia decipiens TaxID=326647 RepID=UPI0020C3136A|nr:uncharacterized protein F4813DRAFT_389418 [Daldinia decipiens]KAI1657681.1 hypothetical protein F4813DRAFT_389418 [Daldinia decipiens]